MRITTRRAGALVGFGCRFGSVGIWRRPRPRMPARGTTTTAAATGVAVTQTNLVSDEVGDAPLIDPNLINPWGMSFGTGATPTPVWVSDNGADVSTLYKGATTPPRSPRSR